MQMFLSRFLFKSTAVLPFLLSLAPSAQADRFEVIDHEGFGRPLVAWQVEVPQGWTTSGRVAWNKPCSSSDHYETIFLSHSPDGRFGLRQQPGYQVFWNDVQPGYGYPPDMARLLVAQMEASRNDLRTKLRNSNCIVGTVEGTDDILRRFLLPNRPSGARITAVTPNEVVLAQYRVQFGQTLDGMSIHFDAVNVDLTYPGQNGQVAERAMVSWYQFVQNPVDMGGMVSWSQHTVINPVQFVWAPADQAAQAHPRLMQIFGSIQQGAEWQEEVEKYFAKLSKQSAEDHERRRKERAAASDKSHKEFLEWLAGNGGGAPVADTPVPETGGDVKTDAWGDPLPKQDGFPDPKPEGEGATTDNN